MASVTRLLRFPVFPAPIKGGREKRESPEFPF